MHVAQLWIYIGFSSNIVLCIKTKLWGGKKNIYIYMKFLNLSVSNSIILLCLLFQQTRFILVGEINIAI